MKNLILIFGSAVLLTACAPPNAVVSDFNGASVKIQIPTLTDQPEVAIANADAEASRICAKGANKKGAEYVSQTVNQNTYISERLYLCLN